MRTIQQARNKRILCCRIGIIQNARQLSDDGIQQSHRRDFTARKHKFPDRYFFINATLDQTFVNSFITPTEQYDAFFAALLHLLKSQHKTMLLYGPQFDEICNIKKNTDFGQARNRRARCRRASLP